jgi:hypothetical protein
MDFELDAKAPPSGVASSVRRVAEQVSQISNRLMPAGTETTRSETATASFPTWGQALDLLRSEAVHPRFAQYLGAAALMAGIASVIGAAALLGSTGMPLLCVAVPALVLLLPAGLDHGRPYVLPATVLLGAILIADGWLFSVAIPEYLGLAGLVAMTLGLGLFAGARRVVALEMACGIERAEPESVVCMYRLFGLIVFTHGIIQAGA